MSWLIDDLTPERRDQILDMLAQRIHRLGLDVPAVLFLQVNRPLSWLYGQALHFIGPVADLPIRSIWGTSFTQELAFLLEDQRNIDRLIERLERLNEQGRGGGGPPGGPGRDAA